MANTKAVGKDERLFHLGDHLFSRFSPKRGVALNEFEEKDSQGPNVYFVVIGLFLNHFWCHVVEGPAESATILQDGGKPKIT